MAQLTKIRVTLTGELGLHADGVRHTLFDEGLHNLVGRVLNRGRTVERNAAERSRSSARVEEGVQVSDTTDTSVGQTNDATELESLTLRSHARD